MTKKIILSLVATLLLLPVAMTAKINLDSLKMEVIKESKTTRVGNQYRSGTCWCFSSLSFFEAEILRKGGKDVDLCEQFVIYNTMIDRAKAQVRTHGDVSYSQGGSFYDVVYCFNNYGICPSSAMVPAGSLYGDSLMDHNELFVVAPAYVKAISNCDRKSLTKCWVNGLKGIYDAYLGELPTKFNYEGKEYTPQTFAKSLNLDMDEYVSLTSFTHHPFYETFAIEVQDNWRAAQSYNLPLDEFMEVMDYAVRNGYTFAWGADVSEDSFRDKSNIIIMPDKQKKESTEGSDQARWTGTINQTKEEFKSEGELTITQEMRQEAFDNWETTDDHGMLIYGLAKDQYGKEYFMMQNSWGDWGKFHGKAYVSKSYIAYKTLNILINKNAIPNKIAKKLFK
ncbi:MAG: aminopeptidase [Prevotellaceae bacterium]|nr:aminopeptidase [Candidatus Faecinaster equi]